MLVLIGNWHGVEAVGSCWYLDQVDMSGTTNSQLPLFQPAAEIRVGDSQAVTQCLL